MDSSSSTGRAMRNSLEPEHKPTESVHDPNAALTELPQLRRLAAWSGIRALAWDGDILYASRGYHLICLRSASLQNADWEPVASFTPVWWRNLTSHFRLTNRLVRDGFHALAILDDKTTIAAVPGAVVTCAPNRRKFRTTHQILRGMRPLHITAVPQGNIYWGEYFDNRERDEVHIYASDDRGQTWQIAHTFAAGSIRHVHNIVYDGYADCLWILTGDEGQECQILCADRNLRNIETVFSGNQQARAVAAIPMEDALYLATDTPLEQNHVLRLERTGRIDNVAKLASSSIFGCRTANALFFSTMAEPSRVNSTNEVHLAGSADGASWQTMARWRKDALPMRYFQYGNVVLPDGDNTTNYLAATTIATADNDQVTTIWKVNLETKNSRFKVQSPEPDAQSPGAKAGSRIP
ncbi:MAG: hypothetical protein WBS24_17140 [Terriglobales bacterium]